MADEKFTVARVIADEITEIWERRALEPKDCGESAEFSPLPELPYRLKDEKSDSWKTGCHSAKLFGICISGGGIRSGTFALGVLQALAEKKLLQIADYVSTVSGGGYIGSWLQGVLERYDDPDPQTGPADPNVPTQTVTEKAYAPLTDKVPNPDRKDPIGFLRKFSNYLSPRHGLSIDSLLIPMIWSRNMILNQAIIIAAFLAAFLVCFWPGAAFATLIAPATKICQPIHPFFYLALPALSAAVAVVFMAWNLKEVSKREFSKALPRPFYERGNSAMRVFLLLVVPIFLAVLIMMWVIFGPAANAGRILRMLIGGALLFVLFLALQGGGGFVRCYREQRKENFKGQPTKEGSQPVAILHVVWMSALCAAFTLLLIYGITELIRMWSLDQPYGSQSAIAWGPPLYVLALMAGIVLQIGLMGRDFPDSSREWLARAGTFCWITSAAWAGYFALTLFVPYWIASGWEKYSGYLTSAFTAWLATTTASVLAGKSGKTSGAPPSVEQTKTNTTLDLIARYGPFIAIAGFLIIVAFAAQWLVHRNLEELADYRYWDAFPVLASTEWCWPLLLLGAAIAVFVILSLRVNINEFSMHHFYKNRLVRCYLGASAGQKRDPDWFTGFDPQDDFPLSTLVGPKNFHRPYPILNATANVTAGTDLATQDRKGLSWIFTPLYSGFAPARSKKEQMEFGGDWPPKTYVSTKELGGGSGIALGTAFAISGAAANPNWGSHSSPQTAFLLTLFDVRLGWWIGNPESRKDTFRRPGPKIALLWLLRELFGDLDEGSGYLNLSDGGHFENLGLYELVRRRCRYIIALDGEEDTDYRFEALGGAVRKCRDDFGVDIVINPRPIRLKDNLSQAHCVVGRIYYPEVDAANERKEGWILYIKSSVTGDEPADVEEYRREHPQFPQESTADQFFTESQFESYRMLGYHAGLTALDRYKPADPKNNSEKRPSQDNEQKAGTHRCYIDNSKELDALFARLAARWEVPPQAPEGAFAHQAEAYSNLMNRLADHPNLARLSSQMGEGFPAPDANKPEKLEQFYFWLDLVQLAEDIFVELNLDDKKMWDHPTYAGWKRLFEYWARQEGLRDMWGDPAQGDDTPKEQRKGQKWNYGKAFRYFFDDLITKAKETNKQN